MKRLILFFGLFVFVQTVKSQTTYTWKGTLSTSWSNSGNWSPVGVPGAADNIKIVTAPNNCVLAANTSMNNITLTSGTLDLGGFTLTGAAGDSAVFTTGTVQNGVITIPAAVYTVFGNGPVTMNCIVNVTSALVTIRNTTFQNATAITKTGITNDASSGGNVFNGVLNLTNAGSGYLLIGNTNPDVFNAAATFNNTGSNQLYVAYNSTSNIFNGVTTFNNSPTANDQILVSQNSAGTIFNNNIVVSSTSGAGVQFDGNASASTTLSSGMTITIGPAGFSAGSLTFQEFTQAGTTPQSLVLTGTGIMNFGITNTFNGNITVSSPTFYLNGTVFNGTTNLTKTGITGDYSNGGNTFNGISTITNSGSSFWVLGNTNPDTWNSDVTFTDNGSERLLPCWGSAGNQFKGNINVNTSGSAQGIQFCGGNTVATATLAATKTIQAGAGGLTAGYLYLRQFTQLGSAPISLSATGSSVLYLGPTSNFGGTVTVTAPDIWAQGATYNSAATFTKTGGSSNHNNQNQNIFNSTCTINQQSSTGYFMLGYNSNDQFNDHITVTSTGTGGIYLGWTSGTGTPTLAASKTIQVGPAGFSTGFLYLNTFTQLGNANMNLAFTGSNTYFAIARNSVIGGALTISTPDIFFNGGTFNGSLNATKTGAGNDYSNGGNTFQDSATYNVTGTGYIVLGNTNPDTWNNAAVFNNSGSSLIAVAWSSAGNAFNGNIAVSSTGSATGVQFCGGNATATATLASGYSLSIGPAGFSTGTLLLRQFTQLGSATTSLNLTGATTLLQVGPSSVFGGDFTVVSPRILLNGAVFSDTANLTKTGATGEWSNGGNTFNNTAYINQQGGGYFGFANSSPDIYNGDLYANNNSTERIIFANTSVGNQFNGNIVLTQIGSSVGIAFGWAAGTTLTQAAGKTMSIGAAGFSTGYLQIERFMQLGNAPMNLPLTGTASLTFGPISTIGGNLISTSASLYFNGCTFNGDVNSTKNGATNDFGNGNNIFNDTTVITDIGSGFLLLGNGNPDQFNSAATFNNSSGANMYIAYNSSNNIFGGTTTFNNSPTANTVMNVSEYSTGTVFNGNIAVSSTSGQGVQFCTGNTTATATLSAGNALSIGTGGFSAGTLLLRQFTQLGSAPTNLTLTGATTLLQVGPSSAFGGDFTVVSPRILLNGAVFSDTTNLTKTGATGEWSNGGNTFNSTLYVNQQGSGYFGFANGSPDIYNGDVYANNNSSERIIFGNNPVGNQFNGNIILTQIGSSQGIAFGWSATTNETQAAGKTISIGAAGFSTGYLQIERFTQLGNAPMNLPLTGTASLTFGPTSAIGGNMTSTSASLYFNGCTFSGDVMATKTGSTNDNSSGNNIFNDSVTITNAGSGYLLFGNGNADQFNSMSTFNNTASSSIYVAYNSPNNIFGGTTTFNNSPTANTQIYVSQNSVGTVFNGNIVVTSTNGQGVLFCNGNTTATATLASGNTISIGSGGFSAGTLLLRQFTQSGPTTQSLTLTGTGNLTFGPLSAFSGNIATVSPTLLFNGCTFNGTVISTKNGTSSDASSGNNTFNSPFTVTNTGAGYLMMGNGNPDLWQSTALFNNFSTAQHMYIAYNSTGNTFNGDVTFNNQPGSTGLWIYPNYYGINTQFNGNIIVQNVNGGGVYFGANTGTATLAGSGSVSIGAAGFNSGALIFRNFTQSNSGVAQNMTTTGTSYIQYGPTATFNGNLTSSSPGLFFNGCTFNGTVNDTKTGTSNDQSTGNNTFNAISTLTNTGTGYLLMTNGGPDTYNGNISFVQNSTGKIYPNYNFNSSYAGNLTITSPAAAAITFGSNTGTATFAGTAGQKIGITAGTPTPIFTRLVIANTGAGVTLTNTNISVSGSLTFSSGLLYTTTSALVTMLNGSSTAPGDATSTSYIAGPMQYQKSTIGASTLNFPIGDSTESRPFILTVNHSTGTLYTYQALLYQASAEALNYTLPITVDHVSQVHYYTINRTAAGVSQPIAGLSGNQTIQIFFGMNDYVSNGGTLTICKNVFTAPTNWVDIGGINGPTYNAGSALTGSITSSSAPTAFNSFSTFTLADKINGGNVLPVGLVNFTAVPDNNRVDLQWTTSSESNNSYFTIEKSKDAANFEFVARIATEALNGNSSTALDYRAQDPSPFAGISYYRLKQTDLDGHDKYSQIVAVDFVKQQTVAVYPNPSRGSLFVTGVNPNTASLVVQWFDLSGKLLSQETAPVQNGTAALTTNFGNGMYLLKLTSPDGSSTVQNIIILK